MKTKQTKRTMEDELRDLAESFRHVTKWDMAIDGGAHHGTWTRIMAQKFAKVWAFEPDLQNLEVLEKATEHLKNVEIRNVALGNDNRMVGLAGIKSTARHIAFPGDDVKMLRLDQMTFMGLGLIKLDLEGAELYALEGARKTIQEHRPVLIIEYHQVSRYGFGDDALMLWFEKSAYREVYKEWPNVIAVPR